MTSSIKTLQLNRTFFQNTLALILSLAMIFVALELLARTDWAHQMLPTPDLRSTNAQFEIKIALLDHLVRNGRNIDCAFLGSSMAESGFDPDAFSSGYRASTGQTITCFNISIDGLSAHGVESLTQLMIRHYNIPLIIWGTSARDYTIRSENLWARHHTKILGPWGLHVAGEQTSPEGWLLQHSIAYRYVIRAQRFVSEKHYLTNYMNRYQALSVIANGYDPRTELENGIDLTRPPSVAEQHEFYGSEGQISLNALQRISNLSQFNNLSSQIVLVELPVHQTYYEYFQGGQAEFDAIMLHVQEHALTQNLHFWPQAQLPAVPEDGWIDRYHLRSDGASVLSQWLGQQIGLAVKTGQMRDPLANTSSSR